MRMSMKNRSLKLATALLVATCGTALAQVAGAGAAPRLDEIAFGREHVSAPRRGVAAHQLIVHRDRGPVDAADNADLCRLS